jgi:hypothetical protein
MTVATRRPTASFTSPRASESLMPAAALLTELNVAGATSTASPFGT